MRHKLIIFFCCCLLASAVFAQSGKAFRFMNYSAKDGLAEKFIYSATQDKQGYMWFGTGTGLYRYDGINFKQFRSNIDLAGTNISNILQAVYTDNTGHLWLGSLSDLQWYNPVKNVFWRSAGKDSTTKKLSVSYAVSFSDAGNNDIWIATSYNYFFRFNSKDSSFTDFGGIFPAAASKTTIRVLHSNNRSYAIHTEGIYAFTDEKHPAVFYPLPFSNDEITGAAVTSEGLTLTTLGSGVLVFATKGNNYEPSRYNNAELKRNNLFCAAENGSRLWVGSYPLFNCTGNGSYSAFSNAAHLEFNITANKIGCLFFDREQNLWICSYSGLSMLPWQNQQITNVVLSDGNPGSLVEPTGVWNLPGTSTLAIANSSSQGLVLYDPGTNITGVIKNPLEKSKQTSRIIGMVQLKDGTLYASDDSNFFKLDPLRKQLEPVVLKDQNGRPIVNVGRNITDSKGNVFISSVNNGFYTWNPATGILVHYNKTVADKTADIRSDNILYPCHADKNDDIWFTSNTGIYRLMQKTQSWQHYTAEGMTGVPPMTKTQYITGDRQGHIWITTINNGLYELYFENDRPIIKNYSKTSGTGLTTDYCIKIKPDKKENLLWLSTINGIHRLNPLTKQIVSTLNMQNGLAKDGGGYTFNITEQNQLVIMFYGACSIIDLNSYRFNSTAPPVYFNAVKVMDNETGYAAISSGLHLAYNENFLQFEFAALQFNNSNQGQYAYMLQGADKDWIYSTRNSVSYSRLAPGKYIFKVKAANNDGVWGSPAQIAIAIENPFWKKAWFIVLCTLIAAAVLYIIYRLRTNRIRREEQLKAGYAQQIADVEMRALRAQMNPHFIFNSLNSIQKYILKNEHFAASQYLTKFSRLIRLILDHSNQNNILLSSEIDLLQLYCEMESLRFDDKFRYHINAGSSLHADTVEIPSMLIQPYIENAIWHGLLHKEETGDLFIDLKKTAPGILQVTVEDNGIGREKAAAIKSRQVLKKKSYGMQITEDRIAIINRMNHINATVVVHDLKDDAGNARGTRVVLEIPLKNVQ